MSDGARAILHVDMDAFYAAIEVHDDPSLAGKPVIIGGDGPRSVVSTASYEARRYGVRSAMPGTTARRLCPDGIFIAPRMARYAEVSDQVFKVFETITPLVEGLSLDEAFLDVTASRRLLGDELTIARHIKAEVRAHTGLTCSIGVARNKLVAKMASEFGKPDGLSVIAPAEVTAALDPLPVGKLWTIGQVSAAALAKLGINTIGDLRRAPVTLVRRALGNHAEGAQRLAAGIDERPVLPDRDEKSLGAEHTFDADLTTPDEVHAWLLRLTERVAARMRRHGREGRTITVKLRTPPFETTTRRTTLAAPTAATATIYRAARALAEEWWATTRRPRLRLLGLSVSGFDALEAPQSDLFAAPDEAAADRVVDRINEKFGSGAVRRAGALRIRSRGEE
jgi:DNA polymerase-4